MTEEKKDTELIPEEVQGDNGQVEVPELELEDVSWELDSAAEPAAEEVPAPPVPEPEMVEAQEPVEMVEPEPETTQEPEPEPVPEPEPEPAPEPVAESEPELVQDMYADEADADYTDQWGWRILKSSVTPFVFDYNNQKHMVSSRGIEWIEDVSSMGRYFTYLIDYPDSPGMGLLTLSTEAKYADVLARKNLEELGELNTEGVLQVYSKRKLEGGQISVFYEILPRDKHVGLSEVYNSYNHGFVVSDTVSLLYGLLKKQGKGAHAMALHLPGAIILVAGKNGNVHLARRYSLIGDDAQALNEGIFALEQDLVALEKNIGQRISHVDWIEGLTWTLNLARPDVDIPLVPYPLHEFAMDGEQVWSALPSAVSKASLAAAIGPKEELYLRPLEMAEKWMWAVFLALAIVAGVGFYSMQGITEGVRARSQDMKNKMKVAEAEIRSRAVNVEFDDVGPAMQLAKDFSQAALYPPFGELWNYMASIRPAYMRVDGLEFGYGKDGVTIRLEGQVEMDITVAQQGFTKFIENLEQEGFKVVSQEVNLDLEGNYYSLDALWPVKKGE
ncbi:hypothetical protein [Desulfovibrio ferrophilus]|uniref:Uncharacterized protein n=1 Tax=Desulfovibrio ferrophilus TaxID=241368 RepID=A0A2Z6AZR5_9BACT|nr:hypothetical protein [Desulfovibrio ferrophilus]BBD08708.1 uncharacterized protein DFE_1982 [Desulfovibrio ferrophilus]